MIFVLEPNKFRVSFFIVKVKRMVLIHCDIWGPYREASFCGAHYFQTTMDDASRTTWVYLMKNRSETSSLLKRFVAMIEDQFGKGIKIVGSDNKSEFIADPMLQFYAENGLIQQRSCVGTLQQNSRVERKHRHALEVARALRFQINLPIQFWSECAMTAAYLINRTPSRLLKGKTPYEVMYHQQPAYDHIQVF